jgi:hypothetical protein
VYPHDERLMEVPIMYTLRSRVSRTVAVALVAIAGVVPGSQIATGDDGDTAPSSAVLDWNAHSSDALINPPSAPVPGTGLAPTTAVIHMAIVQTTVYDAVNAIDGGRHP